MLGEKHFRLLICEVVGKIKHHVYVLCRCDCGGEKRVRYSHLKSGNVRSCGCLQSELARGRLSTHGLSLANGAQQRLHRIWSNMKARCFTETHQSYHNYGARGISVCDEWENDYLSFHLWAMQNGYKSHLTIEREDNDKGYSPSNCKWVTKKENRRNTRTVRLTMESAEQIRAMCRQGESRKEIARKFKISKSHVDNIAVGNRWA